ncbi:MAG: hypothetical protein RLZZ373_2514 [Pseudomonadota bacterium]|jgi:peptidyl-Lys metalloendopeptidase
MPSLHLTATLAGLALAATLAPAAHAAVTDGIDVRLSTVAPVVQGDVDVVVRVTITNTNSRPVLLHPWQLPSSQLDGSLFQVTRDGQSVPYTGPLVKRNTPGPRDVLRLDAGASASYDVELTGAYGLDRDGRYDITYRSRGVHANYATPTLQSDVLYLWLQGRTAPATSAMAPAGAAAAVVAAASVGYTGNCSASQKTTLQQAMTAATAYATGAATYLGATPTATKQRYVKWFGTVNTANWNTAKAHFVATRDAFNTKPVVLDCSCKQSYYAYVYPTQPYKIYVCNAFWSAPLTGTDSKAGTLIHEMTHFNAVASTDDWAYGKTAAAALAISNPAKALDNADSHEYFAENTPVLP